MVGSPLPIRAKAGAVARIVWRTYCPVATVHGYAIQPQASGGWTVSGHLGDVNPFNLTQTPLEFHVPYKGGTWRWPIVSMTRADTYWTARLGDRLP